MVMMFFATSWYTVVAIAINTFITAYFIGRVSTLSQSNKYE